LEILSQRKTILHHLSFSVKKNSQPRLENSRGLAWLGFFESASELFRAFRKGI
jgi:hypothetical protein